MEENPVTTETITNRKWPLDLRKRYICVSIVSALAHFVFSMLEFLSFLHYIRFNPIPQPMPVIRSIGERTLLRRTNSLNRQKSLDLLRRWHQSPSPAATAPSLCRNYCSLPSRLAKVLGSSIFNVNTKHLARVLLRDKNIEQAVNSVLDAVRRMQSREKKSVKFIFAFKRLLRFLADIENSRTSSVIEFFVNSCKRYAWAARHLDHCSVACSSRG